MPTLGGRGFVRGPGFGRRFGAEGMQSGLGSGGRLFAPGTSSHPDQFTPFIVSGNRTVILYDRGRGDPTILMTPSYHR
ncbi:MAG: hypothetical protein MZV70_77200 [Desulfobacterales bacterium]|nr:hypothetical protein [Desulfobacterales bacterium]